MAALRASDADLFSINPLAVSRYRDRYSPSRAKSDPGDAIVLANILRNDMDSHRRLPDDSDGAQAIRVLARVHQDAIWDRQQIVSKARSLLRQYFPAFLQTFEDLSTMGARTVLRLAPTPAAAALRPGWTPARRRRRSSADRRRSACADRNASTVHRGSADRTEQHSGESATAEATDDDPLGRHGLVEKTAGRLIPNHHPFDADVGVAV